jgi:hypothetical protein
LGEWTDATPALQAMAWSAVTSLKPTIHFGRCANVFQGNASTMRIAP